MIRSKPSATTTPAATPENPLWHTSPRPWKPHAGQRKGVKFLLEHAAAGMFADPGCGKTSIAYASFKVLKKQGLAHKALVIVPLRPAYLVWPAEAKKWQDFAHLRVEVLHGPKKAEALARDADIYVINPEGLDWLLGAAKAKSASGRTSVTVDVEAFKALGFDTLIVDELAKFKNPQSNRFKTLKAVLGTFSRRWGLTGSPAANGLMDLFGECFILDMGRSFGPYITHFRSKYFVPSHNGFDWTLRKGAEPEIYERIRPLVLRLQAEDYIDMPDQVNNKVFIDLPPDVQKIYDALHDDFIAKLSGDQTIVAGSAGVAAMRCRQIANGGIYLDPDLEEIMRVGRLSKKREWEHLHDLKAAAIEDLVDELQGSPLLVAYDFQHDLDRLRKRFGKDVPYIGGGVSPKRAAELEGLWNAGKLPILLGHPQCLHPDTLVLTEYRGWRRIVDVELLDRVFDGVEFVSHAGCVSSGLRPTLRKFGIVCTPDHLFYVEGSWVKAKDVRNSRSSFRKAHFRYEGSDPSISAMLSLRSGVRSLQAKCNSGQFGKAEALLGLCERHASHVLHSAVPYLERYDRADDQLQSTRLQSLRREGNYAGPKVGEVRELLDRHGLGLFRGTDTGAAGQREGLHDGELLLGHEHAATIEQTHVSEDSVSRTRHAPSGVLPTGWGIEGCDHALPSPDCDGGRGIGGVSEIYLSEGPTQPQEVFDLVDCGPRHRFVIRNDVGDTFLVHNSMGHGLNLQASGNHVAWHSLSYDFDLYDQFNRRVRRQGNAHQSVFVHHIMARGTVDEAIYYALHAKGKVQKNFLDAMKNMKLVVDK